MRVLIVSKDPTHPTTAGNRTAIVAQANQLSSLGCEVHFLYVQELPLRPERQQEYAEALHLTRSYWGERFHLYTVPKWEKLWFNLLYRIRKAFCHYVAGPDDDYPGGLSAFVSRLQEQYGFDLCIVNYYFLTRLLTQTSIPAGVVFTHDCFAYKDQVTGEKILHLTAHGEAVAMQRCRFILAVQAEEADYFGLLAPRSKVYTIFCHYDFHPLPLAGNHDILFLSGGNPFNVNGLNWFVREIFPAVRLRFPDARLLVGGGICACRDRLLSADGVVYVGRIDDVAGFYAGADVAINPVYQGTGLKIKTFEAVSYGKATLVHPHSVRGIYNPAAAPVLVATEPSQWVANFEKIWCDPSAPARYREMDKAYIKELAGFVLAEYGRLLQDCASKEKA